jgi:tRNA(fMet)-specific endonuclease VapC
MKIALDTNRYRDFCETTFHFARVYGQLRRQGTPIPTRELWIAALAIQHGAQLGTRDAHFQHLPQIPTV